ncbi:MAG: DUF2905 family protein [Anaerolineae bacterium]|nr:DUF2905 family protein [Anaerolineae bacterium]NIN93802.1 DUF2905 family protein [Anaerolineae bacterium]NIQ76837.1 DUF2905 family protein [Anaerolineae bacterium]
METLGRLLLMLGVVLLILGFVVLVVGRVPWVGRLPGDINLRWGNVSCFFPIVTSIVLSILATVVLNLIVWVLRK